MNPPRWTAITESAFPWEKEALDWLRGLLPDREPWHVWSNFEFIDDAGKVNEVDALILSPLGLFLLEIKSRPGKVTGDAHTWTWTTDGRTISIDNPFILANRKAKRLASLLRRQPSVAKARVRVPWVEALVLLSDKGIECKLEGSARSGVYLRGNPGSDTDAGIIAKLSGTGRYPPQGPLHGHEVAKAVVRAVLEAGVRPSNKHRQVGDYRLGALLVEGENYQDWEGEHATAQVRRRVRIYGYALAATAEARQALERQATREFQILEGIEHPGILRVRDFKEAELGPALLFDYEPQAQRLDHFLREHGERLNVGQRLSILRQLAETLKYAHQKKLYHRALSPQSVLVRDPREAEPRLQIMNWQLASREGATTSGAVPRTAGTQHVDEYLQDPAKVYLAPEAWGSEGSGPHLDIFSLGALAWLLFTGQPPAASPIEMHQRLRDGNGLRISDRLDGAGKELQDLVQYSTCPDLGGRIGGMDEFLEYLALVEEEFTAPDQPQTQDPSRARTGDRLEGGFTVIRRVGKGASSDVLLVRQDGSPEERILKVALDASHNDRLLAEGELLSKLHHANIVRCFGTLRVAGRTAILMEPAGENTLAYRLRHDQRFSLDLLHRFGEELLQAACHLEDHGVYHRDIKPENIGLAQTPHSGKLRLVLFDFSLARAPLEDIRAGTRPYLDPFLTLRRPPRWDLYAERFALAMTLYEMVTGVLPAWGDGVSDPALLDTEATLDSDLFDLNLRDGLIAFFAKALRRDYRERFDNAEEMLRAWRALFEQAQERPLDTDPFEAIARRATRSTSIAELGYTIDAQHILDRMGIHNVKELLAVDRLRFRYLKGVSERVRKEIRLKAKQLAQLRPDLAPTARPSVLEAEEGGSRSIDELVQHLLPRRAAEDERLDEAALATYLGLQPGDADTLWPSLGDAVQAAGATRPALTHALVAARVRWLKSPAITEVREETLALLNASGGVATVEELARALLASRGSIEQDDAIRLSLSAAVLRAAIEAEADLANPRCLSIQGPTVPLIAWSMDHADYAIRLGIEADNLVAGETLATPQAIIERLESVERPSTVAALSSQRLLRLAASASARAAVSSRMELYPRAMPALRAMRLALGSLLGPRMLTPDQIAERVLGRYPEAEPLPARPQLDALLKEAGVGLVWDDNGEQGPAYYRPLQGLGPTAGTSTFYRRTQKHQPEEEAQEVAEARQFTERLDFAHRAGGFLALTVSPRLARHAEPLLLKRYSLQRRSLDTLIIDSLRQEAAALRVAWAKITEADAAEPASRDWSNLLRLAGKAKGRIHEALASQEPTLLTQPGLLARYDLMELITDWQAAPAASPRWLLIPVNDGGLPTIDGAPVPVISAAQWARIPDYWIELGLRDTPVAA